MTREDILTLNLCGTGGFFVGIGLSIWPHSRLLGGSMILTSSLYIVVAISMLIAFHWRMRMRDGIEP